MKPLRLPLENVLRAYTDLLGQVFLFLRGRSHQAAGVDGEIFALADALHNIPELLTDYGSWVDDERFREMYLRPFDRLWSTGAFSLEGFLDRQMTLYANAQD